MVTLRERVMTVANDYAKILCANPGMFRLVGVDPTQQSCCYFVCGEFGSRDEAMKIAEKHNQGRVNPDIDAIVYVYNDQGQLQT